MSDDYAELVEEAERFVAARGERRDTNLVHRLADAVEALVAENERKHSSPPAMTCSLKLRSTDRSAHVSLPGGRNERDRGRKMMFLMYEEGYFAIEDETGENETILFDPEQTSALKSFLDSVEEYIINGSGQ